MILSQFLNTFVVFTIRRGPDGTCFEGGVFPAKLTFPTDYPLSPPKMQFTCEMFHPNSNLKKNLVKYKNTCKYSS
jgi:ubiquitin-protein ligase